jgi:PAS domain S-box-containing protein
MERIVDTFEIIEKNLLENSFIKRFLDNSSDKLIYTNYLNRMIKYLVLTDESINDINEVIELFLKKNVKIITILDIFHLVKKEFIEINKNKNINITDVYEAMEAKQNFFIHQYVETYFKKFSNMSLLLEELELKELEFEKQNKIFEEYKRAVDYSSIVSKTDSKGVIEYVNDNFCKISGYSRDELIGEYHNIIRHPDEPKELYEELWDTIKSGKVWQGKIKNRRKDSSTYIVEATIMPILDINGNIQEYIAIRKDITEAENQKLDYELLKATEMRDNVNKAISISNQEFINNIPIASIYIDKEDTIINYNDEFLELFNIAEDNELIDKIENYEASIYDVCSSLDDIIWKYEIDTVDNKLKIELKNSEKSNLVISVKEIEDKFLVLFY